MAVTCTKCGGLIEKGQRVRRLKNGTHHENCKQAAIEAMFSPAQKKLRAEHGTPDEFAASVYAAVPGMISMDEAHAAVAKYRKEWEEAA